MRRLAILLAVLASLFVIPTPAQAGECTFGFCGQVRHYAPDDGYDPTLLIRCNYGDPASRREVPEGRSSTSYCKDTDQIGVRNNEEVWCKYVSSSGSYDWIKRFDAAGWHKINDIWSGGLGCTLRTD